LFILLTCTSGLCYDSVSAALTKLLGGLIEKITPTDADMEPLLKPVEWITSRLLSYRSYESGMFTEGEQIFDRVERGGSTSRGTAIRPIHDIDLVVYMKCCDGGLFTTFEHVLGAFGAGSAAFVKVPHETSILYAVRLADDYIPLEFRSFVVRWQRHSFGICFGENWDDSMTNFDIVPVWRQDDCLYLTSRFSHLQEANPQSMSALKSEPFQDDELSAMIRLFKLWNKAHKSTCGLSPFASFELEAAISIFWFRQEINVRIILAERVACIFTALYSELGGQFRIPGLKDDRGAFVLLGQGNKAWKSDKIKELVKHTLGAIRATCDEDNHSNDTDFALDVWMRIFNGDPINEMLSAVELDAELGKDAGTSGYPPLHYALLDDLPFETIRRLVMSAGQEIDDFDTNGHTALYFAASKGRHDVVEVLLKMGANPLFQCEPTNGFDSLHRAVLSRSEECVDLLLGHVDSMLRLREDMRKDRLAIALRIAVHYPDEKMVCILLKNGADLMHIPGSRQENAWQLVFAASETISSDLIGMLLAYKPCIDTTIVGLAVMRGEIILLKAILSHCDTIGILNFALLREGIKVAVQLGYHEIVNFFLCDYAGILGTFSEIGQWIDNLVRVACTLGFNAVVSSLLNFSPICTPTTLLYCVLQGHYGAFQAICRDGTPVAPGVSDCFRCHATASRHGFKAAAGLFAKFSLLCLDVVEFGRYLCKPVNNSVILVDFPLGRLPLLLMPLLFHDNMASRLDEFLAATDRERLHLFGFCEAHSSRPTVRVCTHCNPIHFLCAQCPVPAEAAHVWETTDCGTNAAIVDFVTGHSDIKETLGRIGCLHGFQRMIQEAPELDSTARHVLQVQHEILTAWAGGYRYPVVSSVLRSEVVSAQVVSALDAGVCTKCIPQYVPQFYFECLTCGLIRRQGCCETCVRTCHAEHDVVIVPRFGHFQCDCTLCG
jgi:ankyrin repeat protein